MAKDSDGNFTINFGESTTSAQTVGTSSTQSHGNFSGLGSNCFWNDSSYTEKYSTIEVQFQVDGSPAATNSTKTLRSDMTSDSVKL